MTEPGPFDALEATGGGDAPLAARRAPRIDGVSASRALACEGTSASDSDLIPLATTPGEPA